MVVVGFPHVVDPTSMCSCMKLPMSARWRSIWKLMSRTRASVGMSAVAVSITMSVTMAGGGASIRLVSHFVYSLLQSLHHLLNSSDLCELLFEVINLGDQIFHASYFPVSVCLCAPMAITARVYRGLCGIFELKKEVSQ